MSETKQDVQVLVVGAGPTGMTAAYELARLGVKVRLVEVTAEPATTSRAVGVQARTLELLQQRGLVAPLLEKGNPGVAGSIYGEGKRLFRLAFANNGSEYGYILFVSQAETEAVLRGALASQNVAIERQVKLVAIAQAERGDGVTAVLRHADGTLEEVTAAYLIDSEGAHSVCRPTLGLHFAGKTLAEDYALGDLYVEGDLAESDFHIFSSEHGFLGMFPMGNKRFRLIASNPLSTPSKDTAPALEELQQIYTQRSPVPAQFHDLQWSSWFRINSRMVDRLSAGRVFLGGDAAHIHSPAGAQGMNTGIQDMVNLAWKLALVLRGVASAALLETYDQDRLPVIKNVLEKTEGLTAAIGNENAAFRHIFAHVAPWLTSADFVQHNSTERMSQLSLNYRSSSLSVTDAHPGSLRAGDRIPNLPVSVVGGHGSASTPPADKTIFDLLSPDRFTLLCSNLQDGNAVHEQAQANLAPWHSLLQTFSIVTPDQDGERFRREFGSEGALVLVRPDGYAAFIGNAGSMGALSKYMEHWFPTSDTSSKEAAHA